MFKHNAYFKIPLLSHSSSKFLLCLQLLTTVLLN